MDTVITLEDSERRLVGARADATQVRVRQLLDEIVKQPKLPVNLLAQLQEQVKLACESADAEHRSAYGHHSHMMSPNLPGHIRVLKVREQLPYVVAAAKEAQKSADPEAATKLQAEVNMWALALNCDTDLLIAPAFLKITNIRNANIKGRLRRALLRAAKCTTLENVADARDQAAKAIAVESETDRALSMRLPMSAESSSLARLRGIQTSLTTAARVVQDCPTDAKVIAEVQGMLSLAVDQLDGKPCMCRDTDSFSEKLFAAR